jgi:hypothetical protein
MIEESWHLSVPSLRGRGTDKAESKRFRPVPLAKRGASQLDIRWRSHNFGRLWILKIGRFPAVPARDLGNTGAYSSRPEAREMLSTRCLGPEVSEKATLRG